MRLGRGISFGVLCHAEAKNLYGQRQVSYTYPLSYVSGGGGVKGVQIDVHGKVPHRPL